MARRIDDYIIVDHYNEDTYVTMQDKNDKIKEKEDGIYVTPIVNVTPNASTPTLVRHAPQGINNSISNTTTEDNIKNEMPKSTRLKETVSCDILYFDYDEDGYTLARPMSKPTHLDTLGTLRSSSCSPQEITTDSVMKENNRFLIFSRWNSMKKHFQNNKQCLVGTCLVACVLVAFIVGFKFGKSSKINEGNKNYISFNMAENNFPITIYKLINYWYDLLFAGKCFERDIEYVGNEISNTWRNSASDCQLFCQATEECRFFTFKHIADECLLKTTDSGRSYYLNAVSGKKYCDMK